jgi:hypothetical protein
MPECLCAWAAPLRKAADLILQFIRADNDDDCNRQEKDVPHVHASRGE